MIVDTAASESLLTPIRGARASNADSGAGKQRLSTPNKIQQLKPVTHRKLQVAMSSRPKKTSTKPPPAAMVHAEVCGELKGLEWSTLAAIRTAMMKLLRRDGSGE